MAFEKFKRIQVDLTPHAYDELKFLKERLEAPTRTELIRDGLSVLRWLADEAQAGSRILVENREGETREVMFNFIERAKRSRMEVERTNQPPKNSAATRTTKIRNANDQRGVNA